MDKGLEDKISDILSSPDELKKIINIAGSLGLGKSAPIETEATDKTESADQTHVSVSNEDKGVIEKLLRTGKSERNELLNALKPYLKDSKREKLDSFLRILNAVEILISAKDIF